MAKMLVWRSKRHVEEALRPITAELEDDQRTDNYIELDLARWMSQLKQLAKPPMVEMIHDRDQGLSTHILLIQLRIPQAMKGEGAMCELIVLASSDFRCFDCC